MIKEYEFNYRFTQKRRGQKKPEKAKRSPLSPDFPFEKRESKKSGDNSDWKVILSSKCQCKYSSVELIFLKEL